VIPSTVNLAIVWGPLSRELAHWTEARRTANLWLRDDDAVAMTPALQRLVKLCETYRVPALLAVIPTEAKEELAAYLTGKPLFDVAVHGFSHKNHAPAGAKKQEFPVDRNRDHIETELTAGRLRLHALFGPKLAEIFVPPWNRIDADVAVRLPRFGFRALSALGRKSLFPVPAPLIEINVDLDIIDWHGNRGGHDHAWLAAQLARQLAWARGNNWCAVGVLTHHLVHDATAWQFLEELFAWTVSHPSMAWTGASELIRSQSPS
jgi:predicted deacetylase